MNFVFRLMLFSILLNISVGILMEAIPAFGDDPSTGGGLTYNANYSKGFTAEMNKTIQPNSDMEDKGNEIYRVLDMLNLGFIQRILITIQNYLYGFIKLLDNILGGYLTPGVHTFLFSFPLGALYTMVTIGYIVGAWSLWTGKDMKE